MKTTFFSIAVLMITLVSCKKDSLNKPTAESSNSSISNGKYSSWRSLITAVPFIAGQNIDAGTIEVSNDEDFIYVTYNTANDYVLTETHLYVGKCEAIPVNKKGNPVPGQFPYKDIHNNITSFTYKVPIAAIGSMNCGCIAAHAAVVKLDSNGHIIDTQTAWGAGIPIVPDNGNWGTKFEYCTTQMVD